MERYRDCSGAAPPGQVLGWLRSRLTPEEDKPPWPGPAGGYPSSHQRPAHCPLPVDSRGLSADFERVGWFQETLNALWPSMRGALERDVIRGKLEGHLTRMVPGLRFAEAFLGSTPPQLHGVKFVTNRSGDPQVVLDLGFHPGNSINVSLALGPLRAAISELSFRGRLCVCLVGLVPRTPVVSGVRVFFANAPALSFTLNGLASALPLPPQKLKEFVNEAIAEHLVLPKSVNLHLDCMVHAFAEPDFLPYHALHAVPPAGVLSVSIVAVEGCTPESLMFDRTGAFSSMASYAPAVYAVLRVGGHSQRTEAAPVDPTQRLTWGGISFSFMVDSPADQDLQVELYNQDRESFFVKCDELLTRTKISVAELSQRLAGGRSGGSRAPVVRVPLSLRSDETAPSFGRGAQVHGAAVVLTGAYRPLLSVPAHQWRSTEALLQVTVDCVVGLGDHCRGRRFSVRGVVLPGPHERAQHMPVSSAVRRAERAQVAKARALHTTFQEVRQSEAKERIRMLLSRGANVSAEEVSWLLNGMLSAAEAAQIMAEVANEGQKPAPDLSGVELLIEEQLRLPVSNPRAQGLRVELWDEMANVVVGVLEWSSLAWLADTPSLKDRMQAYSLDGDVSRQAQVGGSPAKIYLKRALQHLAPEGEPTSAERLPGHRSGVSEADAEPFWT